MLAAQGHHHQGHQQQQSAPSGPGSGSGGPNLNYAHSSTSSRRSSLRAPILSPVREVPSPAPNGSGSGGGPGSADQHHRRNSLSQHDYSYSANTHASRDHLLMHRPVNTNANTGGTGGTYMGQNGRIDRPSSIASTMSQISHGSSGHYSNMTTGTNHRPPSIGMPMGHDQQQQAFYMPPEAKPLRPAPSHSSLRNVLFRTHPTSNAYYNAHDSPLHLPLTHRLAVHPVLALGVVSDPSLTPYGTLANLLATSASHLAALTANGQAGTLAGHAELVTLVHQLTCLLAISLTYMPAASASVDARGDQQHHDQTVDLLPDPDAFVAFAKTASIASICDKLALANATAAEVAATDPRAARAMLVQAVDVASGVVGNLVRRVMAPETLSRNLGVSVTQVLTRVVDALDPEWVASSTLARGKPAAPNVSRDLAKALVIARAALTSSSPTSPTSSSTSSKLPLAPSIDRLWTATHWPESIPIADLVHALPAFLADDLGDAKDPAVAIVKWLVSSSNSTSTSSSPIWRLSDLHLPSDPISPWTLSRTLACLDVDEYVTWKLAGWMYLAVALEQRVYAATKPSSAKPAAGTGVACPGVLATLGGAHLARLAADMQVAMNLVRKRFHYSQQVHARLRAVYARVYQVARVSPGAVPGVLGFDARFEDLLSLLFDTVGLVEALANGDEMPFVTDEVTVAFTATVRKLQTRLAGCVDELGISLPFWTADESADLKLRDSQAEYALRHARDTYVNSVAGLVSDRVLISPATISDIELISDLHDDDPDDEHANETPTNTGAPMGLVAAGKWCGQVVHLYALDQDDDEHVHMHDNDDEDAETLAVQRAALAAALPPVPGLVHVLGLIPPGLALPAKHGRAAATPATPSQSWYIMTSAGLPTTSSAAAGTSTARRSHPPPAFLGPHTSLVPLTARALPLPEAISAARTLAAALLVLYTHQVPDVLVSARQVLVDADALGVSLAGVWARPSTGPERGNKYCAPEWAAERQAGVEEGDKWPATVYAYGVLVWELVVAARGGAGVFERGVPKVYVPDRGAAGAGGGAGEAPGEWRLDMSVVEGAVVDAFPELIDTDAIDTLVLLIDACTSPHPSARPTFTDIVKHLDAIVLAMAQVQDVLPYAGPSGALRPLAEAESLSVWADAEEPQAGGRHERGGGGTTRGRAPQGAATAAAGTQRGGGGPAMAAVMASPMRYPVASVGYAGPIGRQDEGVMASAMDQHDREHSPDDEHEHEHEHDDADDDQVQTDTRYTDATGTGEQYATPAETPNAKPGGGASAAGGSVLKRSSSLTWSAAQRQQEMLARANSQGTVHGGTAVRMGPVAGSMRMGGVGAGVGGTMDARRASMYAQGTVGTARGGVGGGGTTKQRPVSAIVSSMVPSSAGPSRMMSVRGGDSGIALNQQQPVVGTLASNSSGEEASGPRGGGKKSPPKILRKLKDKFSMHPSQQQQQHHGLAAPVNKATISAPMTIYANNAPHAHMQQPPTAAADWIESQLELARGMIRAGELVSAVNVLRPLATNEHNIAAAHLLLGDCYVRGSLATTAIGTSGGTTSRALKGAVATDAALTTAATAPSASGSAAFESLVNTHGLSRNIALARGHYASGLRLAQTDVSSSVMLPLAAAAHAGLGDCMLFTDKHAAEAHYLDALKCPVIAPADAVRARAGLAECLFATLQFREAREHAKLAALMAADVFDTAHKHQVPVWLSSCGKRAAARAALCELQLNGANDQVRNWLHAARAPLKAYAEAMEAWYRAQGMVEEAGRFKGLVGLYHEL